MLHSTRPQGVDEPSNVDDDDDDDPAAALGAKILTPEVPPRFICENYVNMDITGRTTAPLDHFSSEVLAHPWNTRRHVIHNTFYQMGKHMSGMSRIAQTGTIEPDHIKQKQNCSSSAKGYRLASSLDPDSS